LDACILYPAPLRDLFLHLSSTGVIRVRWTDRIHEEWIENLLISRPDLKRERLERTRNLMNENLLDCLVINYEKHIPNLKLPDLNDRHVLAAAIEANASTIVTFNLKDFPPKAINQYNIRALHPDDFLMALITMDNQSVELCIEKQKQNLQNPPQTMHQLLDTLERVGLPKSVNLLRKIYP